MISKICNRFILCTALIFGIGLFTVCFLNVIVDPFSLFNIVSYNGFNSDKPEFFRHLRMAKAHKVRYARPKGLIVGSSRAETGLDPQYPGWSPADQPVYNLGLTGAKIYEVLKYVEHAQYISGVKTIVLGLDFTMFDDTIKNQVDFTETRLVQDSNWTISPGWVSDIISSTTSISAIKKSYSTVFEQRKKLCFIS